MTPRAKGGSTRWFDVVVVADQVAVEDPGRALEEWSKALLSVQEAQPVHGSVATWGGLAGPGARMSVEGASALEAAATGVRAFEAALAKAGLSTPVVKVEATDEALADAEEAAAAGPDHELVGAAEVAEMLGVSRQRVAVLRTRADFPRPLVDLAAGPVWMRGSLRRFLDGWDRRPGPKTSLKGAVREYGLTETLEADRRAEAK